MNAKDLVESVGGRKAAACLSALVVAVASVLIKGDVPAGLADMLKYIVATYVAANVGADVVAAVQAKVTAPAAPPVVQDTPKVPDHTAAIEQIAASVASTQQGVSYIIGRMGPPPPANHG